MAELIATALRVRSLHVLQAEEIAEPERAEAAGDEHFAPRDAVAQFLWGTENRQHRGVSLISMAVVSAGTVGWIYVIRNRAGLAREMLTFGQLSPGDLHIPSRRENTSKRKESTMAKSEARRQKQLAKKKATRKEKLAQYVTISSDDPHIRLVAAEDWPVVAAKVPEEIWERGMGTLILARRCPDGSLACGMFLIDTFCLGVKNAAWQFLSDFAFDEIVSRCVETGGSYRSVTPEHLAKIVEGAVAYARALGFSPHAEFRKARMLLAGIDATQCRDEFTFGRDGKPCYIAGPYDSESRTRFILHQLANAGVNVRIGTNSGNDDLSEDFDDE
jgi:hypothetical protein